MNAYRLNGQAGNHFRTAICKALNIHWTDIYKTVKDINQHGIIETKDGRKFKLEVVELNKTSEHEN